MFSSFRLGTTTQRKRESTSENGLMSANRPEQRNSFQGHPPRAWIVFRLADRNGETREFKLIVDTACPVSFVLSPEDLHDFSFGISSPMTSNLGILQAEWFHLAMPELGLECLMVGFISEQMELMRRDHPEFAGLVGLPFLRQLEFGGNGEEFWICRQS